MSRHFASLNTFAPLSRLAGEGLGVRAFGVGVGTGGLQARRIPSALNVPSPGRFAATLSRKREKVGHGGFTMVELLVTVTIIAMLAVMALGAVHMARESAREIKTKSTIAKLHRIIMTRYESYRSRRVPVNTSGMHPGPAAALRLLALRDIMRMEMPDRWADLSGPMTVDPATGLAIQAVQRPALSQAYLTRYVQSRDRMDVVYPTADPSNPMRGEGRERLNRYSSAECLYMIVTMGGGADSRDQFYENEIGDADDDGLFEFHDGWGNPILFIRWAPGLTESAFQAQTFFDPDADGVYVRDADVAEAEALADHDPFDSRNLHGPAYIAGLVTQGYAYRLVPYIYSAGPDGIYDINFEGDYSFTDLGDPYVHGTSASPVPNEAGIPVDSRNESVTAMDPPGDSADPLYGPKQTPGSLDHYDNIDNHHVEAD